MKLHILYNFQDGPWGGGNQFLRVLKAQWQKQGIYEQSPEKADVVLFNSHHFFGDVFKLKKKFPEKIFIHRVDGPLWLYRGRDKVIDKIIFQFNKLLADGIVFQSHWSKEQNQKLYFSSERVKCKSKLLHFRASKKTHPGGVYNVQGSYLTVIHNAPDSRIFNKQNKKPFKPQEKIKLIAASWSSNIKKGFEVYKYLDENLDFSRYEMVFFGNSPLVFRNIKQKEPIPSKELAEVLKSQDIYITASQKDPCSNSLIEALSCGLPAVALNDGGHTELVQEGGELFSDKQEVIEKTNKVAHNYSYYQSRIPEFSIQKAAEDYYGFAERIFNDMKDATYRPKKLTFLSGLKFLKIKLMFLCSKV